MTPETEKEFDKKYPRLYIHQFSGDYQTEIKDFILTLFVDKQTLKENRS